MSGGFPLGFEICNGVDAGSTLATSFGTQLTTGATANTYGTPAQLTASAPETEWMIVTVWGGNNPVSEQVAVEILIGPGGSERVIVQDLMIQCHSNIMTTLAFPISIPAGTRVSAAAKSSSTSENAIYVSVDLYDGSFAQMEGVAGIDSIGFNSGTTIGTTITASSTTHTKGSFSPLTTSTPRDYLGFFFMIGYFNVTPVTARHLLDIAIGGAGSEKIIVPNYGIQGQSSVGGGVLPNVSPLFPILIPAGTRISADLQSSVASATLDLTLYGLYQ